MLRNTYDLATATPSHNRPRSVISLVPVLHPSHELRDVFLCRGGAVAAAAGIAY